MTKYLMIVQLFKQSKGVAATDKNGIGRFDGAHGVLGLMDGAELEAPGFERLSGGSGILVPISQSVGYEKNLWNNIVMIFRIKVTRQFMVAT